MRPRRFVVAAALLFAAPVAVAQVSVLSSNGMKAVLGDLRAQLQRDVGGSIVIEFATTAELRTRIEAGEAFDVAVLTTEAIDALATAGKIDKSSVRALGRGGIGVGVRDGAAQPSIRTPDEMRRALLAAKSLTFVGVGASRATIERMFETLGIARDVQPKIVLAEGVDAANQSVADGRVELVLTLTSEILPVDALDYVGPLPGDLQGYVSFAAGVSAGAAARTDAIRFIEALRMRSAARAYEQNGMEIAAAP